MKITRKVLEFYASTGALGQRRRARLRKNNLVLWEIISRNLARFPSRIDIRRARRIPDALANPFHKCDGNWVRGYCSECSPV